MSLSFTFSLRRCVVSLFVPAIVVSLSFGGARAQKINKAKLNNAARRSGAAAKVLTKVAALPDNETIPRELLDRAKAVGVFPTLDKVNLLFEKATSGYGVISMRAPGGWGWPAYYAFGVGGFGLTSLKFEKPDVIILFMTDAAVEKFQSGRVKFKNETSVFAGPVGKLTHEKENEIRAANVIAYLVANGKVTGLKMDSDFLTEAVINPDNNINKAVYGLKAREVLAGKPPLWPLALPAVADFQNALMSLAKQ
jgi:lipid-binding SYLF domain-containing protein